MAKYLMLFTVVLAFGCSGSSLPADSGDDVSVESDSGEVDADDSGGLDAAGDSTPVDSAMVDSSDVDATDVDADACAVIGCAMAPVCGSPCTAMCGCCDCGREGSCSDDGFAVNCMGGCYERVDCGAASCSVDEATGVASCSTCDSLQAQYDALTTGDAQGCDGPDACHVLSGHCGVGLGGCYYGVNNSVTQAALDAVAAEWVALDCIAGGVCRCAAPPAVRCDAGGCLLGG